MNAITAASTLKQIATLVSQALESAGITATLSGGGAVSVYSNNEYQSHDLDFVTSEGLRAVADAVAPLGFHRSSKHARQFNHPDCQWYIEFPPGPLAFGALVVDQRDVPVLITPHGPLRIVTPTQIIMDRVSAYVYWNDNQSWDQAVMVAKQQNVDWQSLSAWASEEGIETTAIDKLKSSAGLLQSG